MYVLYVCMHVSITSFSNVSLPHSTYHNFLNLVYALCISLYVCMYVCMYALVEKEFIVG